MTSASRRQAAAAGALLAILAIVVIVQLRGSRPAPPAAAPPRTSNQSSSRPRGTAAQAPVSDVHLDLLKQRPGESPATDRDPFKFEARQAPPSARGGAGGRGNNGGRGRGAQPVPQPPPGPPPLPPIPWRFVGVAELPAGSGRVGAFSDGRGDTVWAKEGDIIDGRYRVLRVGSDSADLAYLDGRGRQSLRLSGQ